MILFWIDVEFDEMVKRLDLKCYRSHLVWMKIKIVRFFLTKVSIHTSNLSGELGRVSDSLEVLQKELFT